MEKILKSKKTIVIAGVIVLAVLVYFGMQYFPAESFSVNTIMLKSNVLLLGESAHTIKITNHESAQNFELSFSNLEGIVSLDEYNFRLESGESKELSLSLKDINNDVNIYAGELIIKSTNSQKTVPIVLGVEDPNRDFAIIQKTIPQYENVYPGGKLGVEIKIFNLADDELHKVTAKYIIKNLDDELILSEEESLVVKGNLETTKTLDIPSSFSKGDYVFVTVVDYEGVKSAAGHLFSVGKKEKIVSSGNNFNTFAIIIGVFLLAILGLFFYFVKTRDDLILQLKRQHDQELKRNLELIEKQRRAAASLKGVSRAKRIRNIGIAKKKIVKKIKEKHRQQRRELKRLRRSGKKGDMKRRIKEWQSQGYKMFETKQEIKKISKKGMGKQMKKWKGEGYKF